MRSELDKVRRDVDEMNLTSRWYRDPVMRRCWKEEVGLTDGNLTTTAMSSDRMFESLQNAAKRADEEAGQ